MTANHLEVANVHSQADEKNQRKLETFNPFFPLSCNKKTNGICSIMVNDMMASRSQ